MRHWRTALIGVVIGTCGLAGADKPRVYITESHSLQVAGESNSGEGQNSLAVTGGSSPQNTEVIRAFSAKCPAVTITSSREKADYVVRFDHEEPNPTTPFTHGNKVAVFDSKDDLVYTNSTHLLGSAVKGACSAILDRTPASRASR